jgi:hypothetical protein
MNFKLTGVRYWKDSFKSLKHFDIIPYQKVVDLYLEVHKELKGSKEKSGWNERPINSDVDTIKKGANWDGFDPMYFNINPFNDKMVMAKADVISMDMVGLGKDWKRNMTCFILKPLLTQIIMKPILVLNGNKTSI